MTTNSNTSFVPNAPTREQLFAALSTVTLKEEKRFRRRIAKARTPKSRLEISADISAASQRLQQLEKTIPEITYPEELPVSSRREDIAQAISENQVVVIAGETGSGKTTQIPKICLELGRGRRGLIGHTQPRRLAARTVAERIAEELGQDLGQSVGYAIRFDDRVSPTTCIKLMTDGILLAEMQRDRDFTAYDTIILDEAHERSLNIDFLLGYLKQLLLRRPDLKLIITSATINPEAFAQHFSDAQGNPAPIIEVSGRTYPVEIRYRPLERIHGERTIDIEPLDGLLEAIEELMLEGPGDILCFFPGERDIRDAMEAIAARRLKNVEVTPLFGRLSNQEQHRVFSPHKGRRIVLATNIAETSLTVPGIHYVIDTGTARISRYSTRTKVQRLPIEPISQASANQRSGRSGRVADGIAIRLYSEQDFQSRPEFTDPEILRTNLASVILQMAALNLGDIEDFPFVQAPDRRVIRDGLALLFEIGAIENKEHNGLPVLTKIGRDIARIPVDPRMARMLFEANYLGVLEPVMVIVAALTIQDIRERPLEHQAHADQLHARFKNDSSDFISYLNLWRYIHDLRGKLSGNAFRKQLKNEYLHHMRSREWRDLFNQLRDVASQLGWAVDNTAAFDALPVDLIHQALLSGLLIQIGAKDGNSKEYRGTRNSRFMIFPGSGLAKKNPEFIMAAEIVETSRLWARDVAAIDPAWLEKLGKHLIKYQYSEPFWSAKRGAGQVYEKATLFGVPIIADRQVPYHRVDAEAARDMFIREALVAGQWSTHHRFFHENAKKLAAAMEVEEKARRRGIVVDEEDLFNFYDARLPASITTGAHFNSWWKKKSRKNKSFLDFHPEELLSDDAAAVTGVAFPDIWQRSGADYSFELKYRFEPGAADDGVSVLVPIPMLAGLEETEFQWLVPGLREELAIELIRSLPKGLRRSVVPAPDFAARALHFMVPFEGSVGEQLAAALYRVGGSGINAEDFSFKNLPPHLQMTFAAVDKRGVIIDSDKDLAALQQRQAGGIRSSVNKLAQGQTLATAPKWTKETLGEISEVVTTKVDGHEVQAFPALVVEKDGVGIRVLPTKQAADTAMLTSTLTLLLREVKIAQNQMLKGLPLKQRVAVDHYPHGGATGLVEEARVAAIRDLMLSAGGPVRNPEDFEKLKNTISPQVPAAVRRTVVSFAPALVEFIALQNELEQWQGEAIDDIRNQLNFLVPPNALVVHGLQRLRHLTRYLQAIWIRLEDMQIDPDRDEERQQAINSLEQQLLSKLSRLPARAAKSKPVKDVEWMIQELRVSLFAQRLGTAGPISVKRIEKAISKLG
ncbi:ATP-dependent RNA helicase HrpA [Corynebacterium caspium]|uniref:ATP-dependent RNA helicase HrpA n=1 Tax=Corynebacterium caspium TaxID=234828 RepID=UPI00036B1E38|nr:ATP-dependent RNA helicase HrpA [Corynebacterium caspium]WKD59132.1 ATP-dependent RNA helicase HrpB [Corynebacterium caspium DSM 44850]